jgi:hypothetical protein
MASLQQIEMLFPSIRSRLLLTALEMVTIKFDGDRLMLIVPENKPEVLRWLACPSRKAELKEVCAFPLSIQFGVALFYLTGHSRLRASVIKGEKL